MIRREMTVSPGAARPTAISGPMVAELPVRVKAETMMAPVAGSCPAVDRARISARIQHRQPWSAGTYQCQPDTTGQRRTQSGAVQ